MKNEALFYVGQKALIEKDGKVLVLFDPVFGFDFPGGKIQEDDLRSGIAEGGSVDLVNSLRREVKEETGFEVEILSPYATWYFEVLRKTHPLVDKKVYMALFLCKYISGDIILSGEHNKHIWVDKDSYQNYADSSDGFAALKKYFSLLK